MGLFSDDDFESPSIAYERLQKLENYDKLKKENQELKLELKITRELVDGIQQRQDKLLQDYNTSYRRTIELEKENRELMDIIIKLKNN